MVVILYGRFRKQILDVAQALQTEQKDSKLAEKRIRELGNWIGNVEESQSGIFHCSFKFLLSSLFQKLMLPWIIFKSYALKLQNRKECLLTWNCANKKSSRKDSHCKT